MQQHSYDMIVIGGSAGSLDIIIRILEALPADFDVPVVLVIHRLKNTSSVLDELLSRKMAEHEVVEPEDKEQICRGKIYLAPQNYHLLVEEDNSFELDYSPPEHYSRPSIDISFDSFARQYGPRLMAILLSGANRDGAGGLSAVLSKGGTAIVQSPASCLYPFMPQAAIEQNHGITVMEPDQIVHCIINNPA